MRKWICRYLTWLCIAITVAGAALLSLGIMRQAHIDDVMNNGAQAVAIINHAQSVLRKDLETYTIDLSWKDETGKARTATGVSISSAFAARIIANRALLVPAVEIRYLTGSPAVLPIISADADIQSAHAATQQTRGLVLAVFGTLGGLLFGWLLPRTGL